MSTKKIALVTGIAGQDGSYLASSDIGYQGAISFDSSKPVAAPENGWTLADLHLAYEEFCTHHSDSK